MKRIDGTVRFLLGLSWILSSAAILVCVLVVLLPWRGARIRVCNLYGKTVSPFILWVCKADVNYVNRARIDELKPAIFVSNHTAITDIFLAMLLCPIGGVGVAKKEVARVPFFGWAYALSGHLLVDRQNRERAIAGLKDTAAAVAKHDVSVWIWPEGTRSKDGRLLRLKKGFVHLAVATGLPVVPVIVTNAYKNWPKHTVVSFVRTPIDVTVLDPIDTTGWSVDTVDEHLAEVQGVMAGALPAEMQPLQLEVA